MPVFKYRQNNSGGFFLGPVIILVQARDNSEADYLASKYMNIYFDGVMKDADCDCCGDRWTRHSYDYDYDDSIIKNGIVSENSKDGFYPILLESGEIKYIDI